MKKISGIITALVTPFNSKQEVDFKSLENLVKSQVKAGITGFVVNGTTGESPTLEEGEVKDIWQAVKSVAGDAVMILGTGLNSTSKTVKLTQKAKDWNADAALVVVPYYNKPPQRGMFQHFKTVAEETGAPVILYNVPGRTACTLNVDTIAELSHVPGIIGIKDATGNMEIAEQTSKVVKSDFIKLSGDDGTFADYLSFQGDGIISVGSHVVPELFLGILKAAKEQNFDKAHALQAEYKDLIDSLYLEANPIPVKKALEMMKVISSAQMRLPLIEASRHVQERMQRLFSEKGLLS